MDGNRPPPLRSPLPSSGGPGPPLNRTKSFLQFQPRRAIASFENLVVLANYEERLKEARKMVWRDRGEPAVDVGDLWECLEHGTRGGLSEFHFNLLRLEEVFTGMVMMVVGACRSSDVGVRNTFGYQFFHPYG